MENRTLGLVVAGSLLLTLGTGCASKKFVRTELASSARASEGRAEGRMTELEGQIEQNQDSIRAGNRRMDTQDEELAEVSKAAQDALERALEAGKLAEGRLIGELILSGDDVLFNFQKSELTDEGKEAIDEFASPLKEQNTGVYIEIQGHTDATGSDEYNLELGEERAESVRRYLNMQHGFPLHRLGVISYGESAPSYDNSTREGRDKNRRVVLVVLR